MKRVFDPRYLMLTLGLVIAMTGPAHAGRGDKAGTSAAPELLIPIGARDFAVGGSTLASTSGIEAIYWNPAGLARMNSSSEAMFSHMNYIADIGVEYIAVASTFEGFGSIGFDIKSLSMGEIAVTTEDNPDGTGERFSPTYLVLGLTYSRLLTDRISVGLTASMISERIDRVSATGIAFNVGLQYSNFANVSGLGIGVAVKNIGPSMTFDGSGLIRQGTTTNTSRPATPVKLQAQSDELPSTIELGLAYTYRPQDNHALNFTGLFVNNNFSDDEYKLGLEYGFDNTFFLRGGYNFSQETQADSYIYGLTAGAGLNYNFSGMNVTFDYAFRDVELFQSNHVFAIKLGF
ncbi:MAG: PorV/PorQ family protein [Ignavibacteria bacterium]|nr:PorV/PorQ family protein [Ignavibacteria bacterium]